MGVSFFLHCRTEINSAVPHPPKRPLRPLSASCSPAVSGEKSLADSGGTVMLCIDDELHDVQN